MFQQKRVFIVLGLWVFLLVGMTFGLISLPNLLPWMIKSPLYGLLLVIPLAFLVYLPVPTLVKVGAFDGKRGIKALGVWCSVFLLGFGAWLIFSLPPAFLVPLMVVLLVLLLVTAHQLRTNALL